MKGNAKDSLFITAQDIDLLISLEHEIHERKHKEEIRKLICNYHCYA